MPTEKTEVLELKWTLIFKTVKHSFRTQKVTETSNDSNRQYPEVKPFQPLVSWLGLRFAFSGTYNTIASYSSKKWRLIC